MNSHYIKEIMKLFSGQFQRPLFCFILISSILFVVIFAMPSDNRFENKFVSPSEQCAKNFVVSQDCAKESPELCLMQENSLIATAPPMTVTPQVLGVLIDGADFRMEDLKKEVSEYIVEQGDTISSIASRFNISSNTIFWANDLNSRSIIQPGQKLIILPVSGVIHYVGKGETLSEIAERYKAKADEISEFNELSGDGDIFIGDILVIPNGKISTRTAQVSYLAPLASSYFICPISPPCRITQGLHYYNAIDFSHVGVSCGEPVFAAAGGTVQKVVYTSRYGRSVRILHPNGVVTYYGHLQDILVGVGQKVSQGTIIGTIGHTGYTIPAGPAGCHVHFDVRGAKNPFAQ